MFSVKNRGQKEASAIVVVLVLSDGLGIERHGIKSLK